MAERKKGYPIGLAGEANYQAAISVCREGEPVRVCHETGNPHDAEALVVVSSRDEIIGYIPRENWLRDAILEEGRGCEATILSIKGEREPMGVVIDIQLTDDEMEIRNYSPADAAPSAGGSTGCLITFIAVPFVLAVSVVGSVS